MIAAEDIEAMQEAKFSVSEAILAHRVRRYHSHPHLAHIGQTNAEHCHGVVTIIALLHPSPSVNLLLAAQFHDAGERFAGDLPQPFKSANPSVAASHAATEAMLARRIVPAYQISEQDAVWLKMADGLEACLFAAFHKPGLLKRSDWQSFLGGVLQSARILGVAEECYEAVNSMIDGGLQW